MHVGERRPVIFILYLCAFLICVRGAKTNFSKERNPKHLFPLLGYLHGYKIGQNFALQLPPYLYSPIIIIPSVNQQQSVNVQKSSSNENYQENGGVFQSIVPAKIIIDPTVQVDELFDMKPSQHMKLKEPEDTLRQFNESSTFATTVDITTSSTDLDDNTDPTETNELDIFVLNDKTTKYQTSTTVNYNNQNTSDVITSVEVSSNLILPSSENKWQNFSMTLKNESNIVFVNENVNKFNASTGTNHASYVYPNAWYNLKVDKISLTTQAYSSQDSLLPSYHDRLDRYSSSNKIKTTSGFRPLAGLYYDGFLNKSVKKRFIPIKSNLV